jgi:hypothetical protein
VSAQTSEPDEFVPFQVAIAERFNLKKTLLSLNQ